MLLERIDDIVYTESLVISDSVDDAKIDTHVNILDVGGEVPTYSTSGFTTVPEIGQREVLSIASFLERPVEIDTFEIKVGDSVEAAYPLWDIISTDPSIRAKLRNFAYFKASIKVRIAVSGTPFHAGKILVSYQPYWGRNATLLHLQTMVSDNVIFRPLLLTYLSQAYGAVVLDVKDNKPVEMEIPFISTKSMHRLFNGATTAIGAATPFADLEEAGSLYFYSINDLTAVSTAPTPVSVQIYAAFQNVQLGTTTATQLEVVTEGGDERATKGPVEKVASSLATFASALSVIPEIGPLAKASSIVFKGVAGVAHWFGWSRPGILNEPTFIKNRPFTNSCVTVGKETVEKICWDPLQELNIDPRIVGVTKDELSLAHLASIESYLTTFAWSPDDGVLASPIFVCEVLPTLANWVAVDTKRYIEPTALCFVAQPFQYWRGTIKFKFEVVCSAFHRGKLAFFFEPNIDQDALINADLSTNKNFLKVIDIQETQSVELTVHWAQPRAWNFVGTSQSVINNFSTSGSLAVIDRQFTNGYIGVVPFTDMQSPIDDDIFVNVYVSSDDIQFNMLSGTNMPLRRDIFEAEEKVFTEGDKNASAKPLASFDLNISSATSAETASYYFGEQPLSFRAALKRYVFTGTHTATAGGTFLSASLQRPIIPSASPAYGVAAITNPNLLTYLMYAFLGVKGGMRKRVRILHGDGTMDNVMGYCVASIDTPFTVPSFGISFSSAVASLFQRGSVMFVPVTNGGIEFELPYYSSNLFQFSCADDFIGDNSTDDMVENWVKTYTVSLDVIGAATYTVSGHEASAPAEDFTFLRFLGSPYYTITV